MANPTVGRVLFYKPKTEDRFQNCDQPCSATVAHVNDDGTLNLCVLDGNGSPHARQNVPFLRQESDDPLLAEDGGFCAWPPRVDGGWSERDAASKKELDETLAAFKKELAELKEAGTKLDGDFEEVAQRLTDGVKDITERLAKLEEADEVAPPKKAK